MIVCRDCGTQNADDDLFCGGCPGFLEHTGERIVDDLPLPEPDAEPEADRDGLVTRIKHAITGDELPPPAAASTPTPTSADATTAAAEAPAELDDDDRRAAALLARPPAPSTAPSADPSPKTPQAQRPQPAKPRPRVQAQPPSRKINPGDLICGRCGEGNPDTRKFCRRCGETLVEAVVAKRPWYRRILPSRRRRTLKAGERPDRSSGRAVGSKARIFRGKVLGRLADARRGLALLAIVGIGVGFAIPSARSAVLDGGGDLLGRVRRVVSPTYSNIPIEPSRVSASSFVLGAEAEQVTDSNTLTYWLGTIGDPSPSVEVVFVETTDVHHVLVHPGQQEDGGKVVRPDPRPRQILFRVTDAAGVVNEVPATLADEDGFQTIELEIDDAVSVETVVIDCFPDPAVRTCPITELEFQSKD